MKTNDEMSDFQKLASVRISDLIRRRDGSFSFKPAGNSERFLVGSVDSADLLVWVYEDDLELRHEGRQFLLEHQDFDDLNKMLSYFLSELKKILDTE